MVELIGASTGIVGLVIQLFAQHHAEKIKSAERKEQRESAVLLADREIRLKELEIQAATVGKDKDVLLAEIRSMVESINTQFAPFSVNENSPKLLIWAEASTKFTRPFLTAYSQAALLCLTYLVWPDIKQHVSSNGAEIAMELVTAIKYLAVTTSTWWFGSRMTQLQVKGK